jgi:hypothetical protein
MCDGKPDRNAYGSLNCPRVLVRFDHVASVIVNADHRIM